MPYDYRKLTPEEGDEIVRIRKKNGYPLHAPPHSFREGGNYLITAACFEHTPIMDAAVRRSEFETRLLGLFASAKIQIQAWVILPNHYHLLVGVDDFDQIAPVIKRLHNGTSYEWNRADGMTGKRRVWYHYVDRCIRDNNHFLRAMNYIHINPVKHGLVESPYDWVWSSLHLYLEEKGRDWLRNLWVNYPPQGKLGFE